MDPILALPCKSVRKEQKQSVPQNAYSIELYRSEGDSGARMSFHIIDFRVYNIA